MADDGMLEIDDKKPIRIPRPDWLHQNIANANVAQVVATFERLREQHSACMETALLLHQLLDASADNNPGGVEMTREFVPRFERLLETIRWLDGDIIIRELEIDAETDRLVPHAGKILQGLRRAILVEGANPQHHRATMNRHRQEWPTLWAWLDRLPR